MDKKKSKKVIVVSCLEAEIIVPLLFQEWRRQVSEGYANQKEFNRLQRLLNRLNRAYKILK